VKSPDRLLLERGEPGLTRSAETVQAPAPFSVGPPSGVVVGDDGFPGRRPPFRGTRVLVRTLFDYIEAGHSPERFLEKFPTVGRDLALHAIGEAKESLLASH
jgi:uncharacterized protein (DUF433 family)